MIALAFTAPSILLRITCFTGFVEAFPSSARITCEEPFLPCLAEPSAAFVLRGANACLVVGLWHVCKAVQILDGPLLPVVRLADVCIANDAVLLIVNMRRRRGRMSWGRWPV